MIDRGFRSSVSHLALMFAVPDLQRPVELDDRALQSFLLQVLMDRARAARG